METKEGNVIALTRSTTPARFIVIGVDELSRRAIPSSVVQAKIRRSPEKQTLLFRSCLSVARLFTPRCSPAPRRRDARHGEKGVFLTRKSRVPDAAPIFFPSLSPSLAASSLAGRELLRQGKSALSRGRNDLRILLPGLPLVKVLMSYRV